MDDRIAVKADVGDETEVVSFLAGPSHRVDGQVLYTNGGMA